MIAELPKAASTLVRPASCFEVGHSDAIGIVIVSMVMGVTLGERAFNRISTVKYHRILVVEHGVVNLDASDWRVAQTSLWTSGFTRGNSEAEPAMHRLS